MADRERMMRFIALAAACALAFGLGWAGATFRAVHEARARDQEPFAAQRSRIEAEEMRLLDLTPGQRQAFVAARDQAFAEANRILGRSRFELDGVMRKSDARIRPLLSPRQLAVYDQLQQERRRDLPERSGDTDD
jgi:Spy/CpxP family protein refolding chaperone